MMSATDPYRRWRTQIAAVARNEIVRSVFGRRALPSYILVGMALSLLLLLVLFLPDSVRGSVSHSRTEFARIFNIFILRFVVFFTNALIFVRLFSGEKLEKTLHYTLLTPMRREVLVLGKYAGGLVSAIAILVPSTTVGFLMVFLSHGRPGVSHVTSPSGLEALSAYILIVVLASMAYGSLFLLAGLFFKNPMVPMVIFLGWEFLTPFLPTTLKYMSFLHYLVSFNPVPMALPAFAVFAQPVSWWTAILALLAASAVLLAMATYAARRLEVTYSAD
jgi:ABC-type transport system involved in multi-copper enzyme maturation permease subunit